MKNAKKIVMAYITTTFELDNPEFNDDNEEWGFRLEDFPLMPGGTKVIDSDGEILYYYDFVKDEIVEVQDGEETRYPCWTMDKDKMEKYYPGSKE